MNFFVFKINSKLNVNTKYSFLQDKMSKTEDSINKSNENSESIDTEIKWNLPLRDLYKLALNFYKGNSFS